MTKQDFIELGGKEWKKEILREFTLTQMYLTI